MKYSSIPHYCAKHIRLVWQAQRVVNWDKLPAPRFLRPPDDLPRFVRQCPVTMGVRNWCQHLNWAVIPEPAMRKWFGRDPVPLAAYIGAFLVKIHTQTKSMAGLRRFLVAHPALVWGLGFPLQPADTPFGFDPEQSLPTRAHFGYVLANLPPTVLAALLTAQVHALQELLPASFGQVVSIDTSLILAWVKENNHKAYIKEGRFDKTKQPAGDPDCKVGCKRRHNHYTPAAEGVSPAQLPISIGEYYWGYASGVVATKVEGWGEFVLAEMTNTFDHGDTTYFFPLMEQVEERLGFRPRYGTADKAYDAFYVYDYFHSLDHDGFAAVPFSAKGGKPHRQFDSDGLPLCDAGLAMPYKFVYNDRTTAIIPYRRAKHVCPLLHPEPNSQSCPISHKQWAKGGCTSHLADTAGSRIRHQLDRESKQFNAIYKQRTAVERIFGRAKALGMERPKLRNQQAIANLNTLIYLLVNLQAWPTLTST